MPKVEVKDLYKIFGSNPQKAIPLIEEGKTKSEILDDTGSTVGVSQVDFQVEDGEVFVVMGLSGSGKSTLIRCLNRLIEPTQGQIFIDGTDITKTNADELLDRKSTRLNSSHVSISYAVFCLKKKKKIIEE